MTGIVLLFTLSSYAGVLNCNPAGRGVNCQYSMPSPGERHVTFTYNTYEQDTGRFAHSKVISYYQMPAYDYYSIAHLPAKDYRIEIRANNSWDTVYIYDTDFFKDIIGKLFR